MSQYEVERIKNRRVQNGVVQYEIKWKGYPENCCSWEPQSNLRSCKDMLEAFKKQGQSKSKTPPKTPAKTAKFKDYSHKKTTEEFNQFEEEQERKQTSKLRRAAPSQVKMSMKKAAASTSIIQSQASMSLEENDGQDQQFKSDGTPGLKSKKSKNAGQKTIKYEIISMSRNSKDNSYHFIVKEGSREQQISREQLIEKDPISIILFYESHMKFRESK